MPRIFHCLSPSAYHVFETRSFVGNGEDIWGYMKRLYIYVHFGILLNAIAFRVLVSEGDLYTAL